MNTFLNNIAALYYHQIEEIHDSGLSMQDLLFVFPNRRAGLFFKQELCRIAKKNIFLPRTSDINRFTESLSDLKKANDIELLIRLYQIYTTLNTSDNIESFDDFITKGTSLLSDFNDIDKFQVDAKSLFLNISELKSLTDNTSFLSESQKQAIQTYWNVVIPQDNEPLSFKKQYLSIWDKLYSLYHNFKESLQKDGIAYEGMIFRSVTDSLKNGSPAGKFHFKRIVFIGFNHLNNTEKEILSYFKKEGIADFYFDYPVQFDKQSPFASTVAKNYKNNMKEFPSLYSYDQPEERQISKFSVYGTPSVFEQGKIAGHIVHKIYKEKEEDFDALAKSTSLILANENILTSAIENMPAYVRDMNITMGYPLRQSPIANLVENIILMQTDSAANNNHFYHKPLTNILTHPYIQRKFKLQSNNIIKNITRYNYIRISDKTLHQIIGKEKFATDKDKTFFFDLFTPQQNSTSELLDYLKNIIDNLKRFNTKTSEETEYKFEFEYLLQYGKYINLLNSYLQNSHIEIAPKTLHLLLNRLTNNLKVQFTGEPLKGFQIMGLLESRLLDFENVIILGFNDENIPGNKTCDSMIPYSLRKAYKLPTNELSDAIYAYNFYRMSYRAKNIHLIYNSRHDDTKSEISRFYYQIKYLIPLMFNNPDILSEYVIPVKSGGNTSERLGLDFIEKSGKTMDILEKYKQSKYLSPSRLKHYICCPLKFYFSTIVNLREPDEVEENTQASLLGNIYHKAMELYYRQRQYPVKTSKDDIMRLVDSAIADSEKDREPTEIKGFILLIKNVVCQLVETTVNYDLNNRKSFEFHSSETEFNGMFNGVNINGIIDRIDRSDNGTINLIDYKTTRPDNKIYNILELFTSTDSASNELFQIILYCHLYLNGVVNKDKSDYQKPDNITASDIKPQLYNIYKMAAHVKNGKSEEMEPIKLKVPNELLNGNLPYDINIEEIKTDKSNITEIEVINYEAIRKPFEWGLTKMFAELFDQNIPFMGLEEKKIAAGCKYCPYIDICGNENKTTNSF